MPISKKKRLNLCNHDFVCLASTTQSKPPTSFEAGELMTGGLGKKQLTLFPPPVQTFFKKPKLKSRLRSPITLALLLHSDNWLAFGGTEFLSRAGALIGNFNLTKTHIHYKTKSYEPLGRLPAGFSWVSYKPSL